MSHNHLKRCLPSAAWIIRKMMFLIPRLNNIHKFMVSSLYASCFTSLGCLTEVVFLFDFLGKGGTVHQFY